MSGARAVAQRILARGAPLAPYARHALVNGRAGVVVGRGPKPISVVSFAIEAGRITQIDVVIDPAKLPTLDR